ncbi:MAG: YceI family protein [Flavobacteriaceae bacterium]|nr:YceI family protein [Bacteroidia bacterium]NNL15329.1 YceI family protein [Flavobacteriaceae bacterium]
MQNNIWFKALVLGILIFSNWLTIAQTGVYGIDSNQSKVSFKISHMGALKVNGIFSQYSGQFIFRDEELLAVNCRVLVESVNTNSQERDDIIKNEAYFDIDNYPYIKFQADEFFVKDNNRNLKGLLRIKEGENTLTFPYDLTYDKTLDQVKLMAETEIKRKDFNLVFGSMNGLIGNKVRITLEIIATKQ